MTERQVTKREMFAAMALQGLLANPSSCAPIIFCNPADIERMGNMRPGDIIPISAPEELEVIEPDCAKLCALAVKYADALLEALETNR